LQILKLPQIQGGNLVWPLFNGTLFFLVNPVFVMLAVSLFKGLDRKRIIYLLCFLTQFVLLLTHKTMGGYQFGCRYLTDMIPFMLFVFEGDRDFKTYQPTKAAMLPFALLLLGAVINIYGAVWFYSLPLHG